MSQQDQSSALGSAFTSVMEGEIIAGLPHCKAMGMELLDAGDGCAVLRLPYSADLIGDPATGIISGGAVTALLDSCCGAAVMSAALGASSAATLDLRIDYMRPATPEKALIASAEVYRTTRTIAFVSARAYHENPDEPVATATATFVLERKVTS